MNQHADIGRLAAQSPIQERSRDSILRRRESPGLDASFVRWLTVYPGFILIVCPSTCLFEVDYLLKWLTKLSFRTSSPLHAESPQSKVIPFGLDDIKCHRLESEAEDGAKGILQVSVSGFRSLCWRICIRRVPWGPGRKTMFPTLRTEFLSYGDVDIGNINHSLRVPSLRAPLYYENSLCADQAPETTLYDALLKRSQPFKDDILPQCHDELNREFLRMAIERLSEGIWLRFINDCISVRKKKDSRG